MIPQQIPSRKTPSRTIPNQKITRQSFSDVLGQSPSEASLSPERLFGKPHPECSFDRRKSRSFEPRVVENVCDWTRLPSVISAEHLYPSAPMDIVPVEPDPVEPVSGETVSAEGWSVDTLEAELAALLIRFDFADGVFPSETIAAYADLSSANQKLRLYALAWTAAGTEEMSLYLVLQPMAGSYLPLGTEVSVVESDLVNTGQNLRWTSHPVYLYTQIFGAWESQFSVNFSFPDALPITLSPLMLA